MRRLKVDVLTQLPPKVRARVPLTPDDIDQAKARAGPSREKQERVGLRRVVGRFRNCG